MTHIDSRISLNQWLTIVAVCFTLLLIVSGLIKNYSLWTDELYTIVAAGKPVDEMLYQWLLPDVHPPLYQLILKIWIGIIGSSEFSARLLSALIIIMSLFAFYFFISEYFSEKLRQIIFLLFASSFLLSFYGQEARPYALLLLMSVLSTRAFMEAYLGNMSWYSSVLFLLPILSLTHYFGLIYAFNLYLFLSWKNRFSIRHLSAITLSGISCLIWPYIHLKFGEIGGKAVGGFWIESAGPAMTLSTFSQATMPYVNAILKKILGQYQFLSAAITVFLLFIMYRFIKRKNNNQESAVLSIILGIMVLFLFEVSLIDLFSPVSTNRNFIVLWPVFSCLAGFLITEVLSTVGQKTASLALVAVLLIQLIFSITFYRQKSTPLENIRGAIQFVNDSCKNQIPVFLLHDKNDIFSSRNRLQMIAYYLADNQHRSIDTISTERLVSLQSSYILLSMHTPFFEEAQKLLLQNSALRLYYPKQHTEDGAYVLYTGDIRNH